nr:hypothetical protein [Tanacetum cinerariifolium]
MFSFSCIKAFLFCFPLHANSRLDSLRTLVKTYRIPLNLNTRLLDSDLSMDHLPSNATDIYTQSHRFFENDVTLLCAHLTRLHEINEAVLVRSRLSFAWFNQKCDMVLEGKMIIMNYTTAPAVESTPIPLPTPKELVVGQPNPKPAKKSKALVKQKASTSLMGHFEVVQPKGLAPPYLSHATFSDPSHVGTSSVANASSFDHADVRKGDVVIDVVGKACAKVIRQQLDPMNVLDQSALSHSDQIPNDEFSTATLGEEIDLMLFPLDLGPNCMSYLFPDSEGSDPLKYTREEWDGPHASEANILSKDIFKDPNVFKRALDRTITLADLKRTESLLPLQLFNRMSVLTSLFVVSNTRLREKIKRKLGYLTELHSEISDLGEKHEKVKRIDGQLIEAEVAAARLADELARIDTKLSYQALVDEFNATLARILSLGITFGVEKGLRMRRTDAEFEEASPNVSNFFRRAEAEFNKEMASVQPDKVARSVVSASALATPLLKEPELPRLVLDASSSLA